MMRDAEPIYPQSEESEKPQETPKAKVVERVCARCGKTFIPSHGRAKYCSDECRDECRKERRRVYNKRQEPERKKPKPAGESSKKVAAEVRRKESLAHLGEINKAAHESGMSYGQYMAAKRLAKGECT